MKNLLGAWSRRIINQKEYQWKAYHSQTKQQTHNGENTAKTLNVGIKGINP